MAAPSELTHLLDLSLRVEATVYGPALRVSELLALRVGSVIATRRAAGESIDIVAGNACIGAGEMAQLNGHIAVRMVNFKGEN